jgi:hypothetical protein
MRMFLDNTQLFFIPNQEKKIEFVLFSWTDSTMNVKTGFNRNLTSSKYNSWTCSKQSNNPFCHPSKNFPKRNNPKHIISCHAEMIVWDEPPSETRFEVKKTAEGQSQQSPQFLYYLRVGFSYWFP